LTLKNLKAKEIVMERRSVLGNGTL
jgi:hypothetical protein